VAEVTAVDRRAFLARTAAVAEPVYQAFNTVLADEARAAAKAAGRRRHTGPLHGIPLAIKDNYWTKRVRTTAAPTCAASASRSPGGCRARCSGRTSSSPASAPSSCCSNGCWTTARWTRRWSAGRVTLLGDAGHAMLPFMAQGAAQAIEDGATLGACLRRVGPDAGSAAVAAALHRYEQARLPRTSRLQAMSAGNKTRFHLPDGPAQRQRDSQMAAGSEAWSFNALGWLYEHDAAQLPPAWEDAGEANR
jgi:2-polyprenyl-6-methoxyphenol hydroxylase-like FAD-dependent oxidoreductase